MDKEVDLNKSVYELYSQHPEIVQIMQDIGFKDIANPAMLNTAGRFMTIAKGAAMKNIDMDIIKQAFEAKGFRVLV
ncbi:MAG: hypothetical protein K0S75_1612 [Clostridia bacterium]|jgi:hypothetical protein|nr:hypothetical protein [Clostridia bacterium]